MRGILSASVSLIMLAATSSALAQDLPPQGTPLANQDATSADPELSEPAAQSETAVDGDIVVTGSRAIVDGSRAPTPVTVVSGAQLETANPGTIAQGLNQLPAFRGSSNAATGQTSSNTANSGSFVNLRNLGPQRTLILLDGRRAPLSTPLGTTDTNILPQELVKRVDVVTGGASAAYGSDAVAGVVNFVLDTGFEGLKGSIQAGTTTYGDNGTQKATLTVGSSFAGGRGRLVASGAFFNSEGVDSTLSRPWGRDAEVVVRDPANPTRSIIVANYRNPIFTPGGLVYAGANAAIGNGRFQFLPDGSLASFNPGSIANGVQTGGQGPLLDLTLLAKVRYGSGFAHAEFDVTDSITVFAEGMFGSVRNNYRQVRDFAIPAFNAPTILITNPFLSTQARNQLLGAGVFGFQLGRFAFDTPPATATTTNDTINLVGGAKWKLGNTWQLDAYYEHSRNRQFTKIENNLIYSRFFAAVDAVSNPANGQIVCNVALTNPGLYPGCVPINLFGQGSPSAAAINYIKGTSFHDAVVKQDVAEVVLRGQPIALPAGPLSIAISADYRKNSVTQTVDPLSRTPVSPTGLRFVPAAVLAGAGNYILGNVQPIDGEFDVKEIAGEVNVPILSDASPVGSFDANGAVRYTDYSISGSVTTWKAGAVWRPLDGLALRATVSRDIRAPNLQDLFGGSIQSQVSINDTRNNLVANIIQSAVGSTDLDPEKAKTYTAGVIFTGVPGLTASVDYFNINTKGVIRTLTPQQTIDACTQSGFVSPQCANLVYTNPVANTGLVRVFTPQQNLARLQTSGIDAELGYAGALGNGQIQLRALASYLIDYKLGIPGGTTTDFAGVVGTFNNPEWTALASASYAIGGFTFYAQERLTGGGKFQAGTEFYNPALSPEDNEVGDAWYTDVTVKFDVGKERKLQFFATVNNLFNEYPPIIPSGAFQLVYPTNAALYDVAGRTITVGARFKLW